MAFVLEGVKIIEMGTFVPANMTAQHLGDLGTDVIVVEPVRNRALGPEWSKSDRFRPENNRNKRMITLDLKQEEARAILHHGRAGPNHTHGDPLVVSKPALSEA